MIVEEGDYVAHYGILRRSGRYPWGSGGPERVSTNPNKRNKVFLDYINDLRRKGLTEKQIADGFGTSIHEVRAAHSIASNEQRQSNISQVQRLKDKGYSKTAISARTGLPESTVRSYLEPGSKDKADVLTNTAGVLKTHVNEKGLIDVGKGVENHIGVSRTRLDTAVEVLKQEGYKVHYVPGPQVTTGHNTNMKVLCPPDTTWAQVMNNRDKIQQVVSFSDDGGRSFAKLHDPLAIDPKRVSVNYKEDGGDKADGMIYIRPGVNDVSIGGSKYAQVRVAVGPDHYLKGMAIYKDDLPDGVDVQFNTNKSRTDNKLDAMKKNSEEPGYSPDGPHPLLKSIKRQIVADAGSPNERVTSAMNIVNEEGNWGDWSHQLSSQMLSKQSPTLAKSQLDMTHERRQQEYDNISKLTNATVRKKLLNDFADATDSASVELKAAALPRTGAHVILPLSKIKPTEIYAPNYVHGEKVVLIRHPHGGTFEIPELIVNNKNQEARNLLGGSRDAVGIHHTVAQHLSGADFDGDTVLVIPNSAGRVKHTRPLDDLKNFDPRSSYPSYEGMKRMKNTQTEMGKISNLITDMSIQGAPHSEIARAVKHSMVVIDAEKHNLNHKLSYQENGIKQLQQKYQTGGASTLISRAGAEIRIPQRKPRTRPLGGPINLKTGEKEFEPTNKTNFRTGKLLTDKVKKLAVTKDARALMSTRTGTPMERLYADHSNKLKSLANKARLTAVKTPNPKISPSAKRTYTSEVKSLNAKLAIALRNAPLERQAQLIAATHVKARKAANPNMDPETEKKISYQALVQARIRTGAEKQRIRISQEEWNAIQAGAISNSKLNQILNNSDMDVVRELATPKTPVLMTSSKTQRAQQMLAQGYDRADVAAQLGVSLSTLDRAIEGG